jgi:hypothetical protein
MYEMEGASQALRFPRFRSLGTRFLQNPSPSPTHLVNSGRPGAHCSRSRLPKRLVIMTPRHGLRLPGFRAFRSCLPSRVAIRLPAANTGRPVLACSEVSF